MLIGGFYGNSSKISTTASRIFPWVQPSFHLVHKHTESSNTLEVSTQERIFAQWTSVQAELAALTFPQIGSISHFSTDTGPVIGPIASSPIDRLVAAGPFHSGW